MYGIADVPEAYRPYFFINEGGPARKVVSREVVDRHWQFISLDCGHQVLRPKYQKTSKVRCGFCGGFQPLPPLVPANE